MLHILITRLDGCRFLLWHYWLEAFVIMEKLLTLRGEDFTGLRYFLHLDFDSSTFLRLIPQ